MKTQRVYSLLTAMVMLAAVAVTVACGGADADDSKVQFVPAGTTLTPLSAPYLTKNFNRFGNMNPSTEQYSRSYLLMEEPFKIVGNIYFVGNTWESAYLIDTGAGLILFDGGISTHYGLMLNSIRQLGFNPKDIKHIYQSHAHPDHYGAVKAMQYVSGAKTFIGDVDGKNMVDGWNKAKASGAAYQANYNEAFIPDVYVKDGEWTELGNVKMQWVMTPGHTDGVMSHFWTVQDQGKTYKVGIYGGAGFSTMSTARLQAAGKPLTWQTIFVDSINKVWDREVDVMLGNHPFHADLFEKHERFLNGDKNAFIDPTEWHRFLQELKDSYAAFLKLTTDEVTKMYEKSSLLLFRGISLPYHEWPNPIPTPAK